MIKFTLRTPDYLHDRLTVQAATDRRSLNSELLHLLEVALNAVAPDAGPPGGESATPDPLRGKPDFPGPKGPGTLRFPRWKTWAKKKTELMLSAAA